MLSPRLLLQGAIHQSIISFFLSMQYHLTIIQISDNNNFEVDTENQTCIPHDAGEVDIAAWLCILVIKSWLSHH
jgi:hypothetical protein